MAKKRTRRGNGSRAVHDTTGSKPAERDLRGLEEEWRSLVENIPDIIMTVDADGTILFTNRTVPGLTVDKVTGTSVYDYLPPEHHDTLRKPLERVFQSGKPFSYEIAGAGPFGHTSWYLSRIGPIVRDGMVVAAALITTDITERKRAEEELRENRETLLALLNAPTESALLISLDGVILALNETAAQRLGGNVDGLVGLCVYDLLPPEVAANRKAKADEVARSGKPCRFEDGRQGRRFDSTIYPVFGVGGKVGRLAVFGIDVTERKRAEEALRTSEERYRDLAENLNDAIFEFDTSGRITFAGSGMEEVTGYGAPELIGRPFIDLVHPDDLEGVTDKVRRRPFGDREPNEYRLVTKSGEARWVRSLGGPVFEGSRVVAFRAALRDITERKRAEQALRESEERYRRLVENAADIIFRYRLSPTPGYEYISPAVTAVTGYTPEEFYADPDLDVGVVHPDDRETLRRIIKQDLTGPRTLRWVHKDGSTVWTELRYVPIYDGGNVVAFEGIARNITEHKRAEDVLRESEEKYRRLVQDSTDGIVVADGPQMTFVNSALLRMFGCCSEWEMIGRPFTDFVSSEYRQGLLERNRAREQGQAVPANYEFKALRKDGSTFEVDVSIGRVAYQGKVVTQAIVRDISERKRAEQELHALRQRLQYLVSTSPAVIYAAAPSGDYAATFMSENVLFQLGYEAREFVQVPRFWADHIHPEDAPRVLAELPRVLDTGYHVHEYRFLHKDGTYRWMRDEGRLIRDADGNPAEIVGYWVDVTERKEAEEALHESENRYRELVEDINDIIYEVDASGRITYVSPVVEDVGGYKPSEMVGRSWAEFLHPDDHAAAVEDFRKNVSGDVEPREYRMLSKSGETHWLRSFGRPIVEGDRIVGVRGVLTIITDRKRAEEALRESEERWRSLAENAPDIIMTVDADSTILFANRVVPGLAVESVIGTSLYDYLPPEHRDRQRMALEEVFETGEPQSYEIAGTGPGGRTSWYFSRIGPVVQGGNVVAAILITTDITEQRLAEEALEESEERYRTLVEAAPDAMVVHSDEKILFVNSVGVQLFGAATPDQIIGRPIWDFVHPENLKAVRKRMRSARAKRRKLDLVEEKLIRFDGRGIDVEMAAIPVAYEGKAARQVVLRDITERKRMEEALQRTREDLDRKVERRLQRGPAYGLTFRELTVLHLMADGKSDREIGTVLGISTLTAQKHVENIRGKMQAASRTEASVRAVREGLLG